MWKSIVNPIFPLLPKKFSSLENDAYTTFFPIKMWGLFPPEIQLKILSHVPTQDLPPLSCVSKDFVYCIKLLFKKYILETKLEDIVAKADETRLKKWKEVYYDKIPTNLVERKILLYAILFFVGKYRLCTPRFLGSFNYIISDSLNDFRTFGLLFYGHSRHSLFVHDILRLTGYTKESLLFKLQQYPEISHPLFGKITVHNPHFQSVCKHQLRDIFD